MFLSKKLHFVIMFMLYCVQATHLSVRLENKNEEKPTRHTCARSRQLRRAS